MNRHLTDYNFPETSGNRKDQAGVCPRVMVSGCSNPLQGDSLSRLPDVGAFCVWGQKKGHGGSPWVRYGCAGGWRVNLWPYMCCRNHKATHLR